MGCSLQRSSIHGILQARILDQVAISYSRGILLTQGLTLCLLHWQADYLPLHHLGSPYYTQKVLTTVIHSTVPGSLSSYFWLYAHHQARSPRNTPARDTMRHSVPYVWHDATPLTSAYVPVSPETDLSSAHCPLAHILLLFKSSLQIIKPSRTLTCLPTPPKLSLSHLVL